jgi:hypothetical protein
VKTEQPQDCWGDLRRLGWRGDGGAADGSMPCHQDRDIPIFQVVTAVLGDLAFLPV